jgi:hypothetical protein
MKFGKYLLKVLVGKIMEGQVAEWMRGANFKIIGE